MASVFQIIIISSAAFAYQSLNVAPRTTRGAVLRHISFRQVAPAAFLESPICAMTKVRIFGANTGLYDIYTHAAHSTCVDYGGKRERTQGGKEDSRLLMRSL